VIVDIGIRGVTHRRVANAARVSLSATTYYFESLDDLLEQPFARSVEGNLENLRRAIDGLGATDDVVKPLAAVIHRLAADRGAAIVASEEIEALLQRGLNSPHDPLAVRTSGY
jgi:TetR/AcrR family transcriptional regulator, regulator of biofilm formation and stress response